MNNYIKKDELEDALTPQKRRELFETLGFEFPNPRGSAESSEGWVGRVRGPNVLGEGENPNFSVNLEDGVAKDFGSSGYKGDLYQVVQDVQHTDFAGACRWIASRIGYNGSGDGLPPSSGDARRGKQVALSPGKSPASESWDPFNDGVETAVYTYRDKSGTARFEVVRFEPEPGHPAYGKDKTFRQRTPDGDWGRSGTEDLLYQLPSVIEAVDEGKKVFVCEGEKDVHTLIEWELTATTPPGGARSSSKRVNWQPKFTEALRGADVVILPDNDEAGRAHAQAIARSINGDAGSVRVIDLPDLPDKGDVSDWKDLGGTRSGLLELVSCTEPWLEEALPAEEDQEGSRTPSLGFTPEDPSNDRFDLTDLPDLSPVYNLLPEWLQDLCDPFDEGFQRDVVLTGCLTMLSGCLPNVVGRYGEHGKTYGPNLYTAVVAAAGAGKGALQWAHILGLEVDSALRRGELDAIVDLQNRPGTRLNGRHRPGKASLFIPGNTSSANFHHALEERGGRAVMFETEIDTLATALKQEWGQFGEALRKAAMHEVISSGRRTQPDVFIDWPSLSVLLSGTPKQFSRLIRGTEDGLYSRFLLYHFEGSSSFRNQKPSKKMIRLREKLERRGDDLVELVAELSARSELLWYDWTDEMWGKHKEYFSTVKSTLLAQGLTAFEGIVHRAGLAAYRLSMILSVLRTYADGENMETLKNLEPTHEDLGAALLIANVYAEHSIAYAETHLQTDSPQDPQVMRIGRILQGVESQFTSQGAYDAASNAGIAVSNRTIREDLNQAVERGLVRKVKRGLWEKK